MPPGIAGFLRDTREHLNSALMEALDMLARRANTRAARQSPP
ncbi:hypothetical protein QCE63_30045 [Caballeronia sp. LZ065]|nr:hypothetical protein [Caballeronia sp. LZ065]MDR5783660.1 hypothetical protein [Caballeronia sp. LZ065]